MNQHNYEHAIVIGSSIAGLAAAAVLTRHFKRVTIVERDRLPLDVEFRKGIPQASQAHILLKQGQMILESLFPGMTDELIAAGVSTVNMGSDLHWFVLGDWRPRFQSSMELLGVSRPQLETVIRRHLNANPQVSFLQEATVTGLLSDANRTRATGVKVAHRNMGEMILPADLVVDASGRSTKAPTWLELLDYPAPEKTAVNAHAGYSSRFYEIDPDSNVKAMYIQATPITGSRGGVILPQEGNRWHVSLVGIAGDYPPTDEAGFLDYARSLPTPEFYNALENAKPLTEPVGFRHAENRLYRYHELSRYLENFVALGDSVFALNPVYGQGMTVAAISALNLGEALSQQQTIASDLSGLAERFQKSLWATLALPWGLATGEDMRWQGTEIEGYVPPPDAQALAMREFMDKVFIAANRNQIVLDVFYRVQNMVDAPDAFFQPGIVMLIEEEYAKFQSTQPNFAQPEVAVAASVEAEGAQREDVEMHDVEFDSMTFDAKLEFDEQGDYEPFFA